MRSDKMSTKRTKPFGAWKSPISASYIATAGLRFSQIEIINGDIYWNELRPAEDGRCVVCKCPRDGIPHDLIAPPFNARTRVHEYGGGAYLLARETLYFSNFADQRLYRLTPGTAPRPITPEAAMRYADCVLDAPRNRIICIREDHSHTNREPVNAIVAINPDDMQPGRVLIAGNDFYAAPRVSPDGAHLAWLTWNHPDMPWDAAELWLAPLRADGSFGPARHVAGGPGESICQPRWSPDGILYFVSDRTNWWNLYRLRRGKIEPVTQMEAEFAVPEWVFRTSNYAFADRKTILCAYTSHGLWRLARIDAESCRLQDIPTPFNTIASLSAEKDFAAFIAGAAEEPPAVVRMHIPSGNMQILRRSGPADIDPAYISKPEAIEFPTENGLTAHGLFYVPQNPLFTGPPGERPPLLVMVHGGPTSTASAALRLAIQYYTSRGIAVLDVNYGGSTGYGRAYRERLYGRWGIVDVDDCVNGARFLAAQGRADQRRLAITGGSAGGYTTLAALTFRNAFAAGASHYGVSDCEALARDTHKFESHYLDKLIGPYPERRDLYRRRSPIHHAEELSCPVIFFQGLQDKIVPPDQAEKMVAALREKGIPVAYVAFDGEQHGFRKAENIRRALENELYFFSRIFRFRPADPLEPMQIENLPDSLNTPLSQAPPIN